MKLRHLLMGVQGVVLCLGLVASAPAGSLLGRVLGLQESSPHAKPYAVLDEDFEPTSVVWSPDGKYIADDGVLGAEIHVWDVARRSIVKRIALKYGAAGEFSGMAWSPDGRYLVAAQAGNHAPMLVIDTSDWQPVRLQNGVIIDGLSPAFSQDGKLLAFVTVGIRQGLRGANIMRVYRTGTWQLYKELIFRIPDRELYPGWGFSVDRVAFQPGTHNLAIGMHGSFGFPPGSPPPVRDANGTITSDIPSSSRVIFWNLDGHMPDLMTSDLDHSIVAYRIGWEIEALVFSPNGRQMATGTLTGVGPPDWQSKYSVHIYDPNSHALLAAPLDGMDHGGWTDALGYIDEDKYLLVGHEDKSGAIDVINTRTFKVAEILDANGFVSSLAVDPSRPRFVVTSNRSLMIWNFVDKP